MSLRIHSKSCKEILIFQPTLLVMRNLKIYFELRLFRQKQQVEEEENLDKHIHQLWHDQEVQAQAEVEAQDQAHRIQEWEEVDQEAPEVPVDQVWVEEDQEDPVEWVDQEDLVDIQELEEVVQAQVDTQEQQAQEEELQVQEALAAQVPDQALEIYSVVVIH
jgi:hypothetical protein